MACLVVVRMGQVAQNANLTAMQAWVFAAIASEDQRAARKYYAIALLYAWPTLLRGLDLDAFSIACLLAGILHVQVSHILSLAVSWHPAMLSSTTSR